MKQGEMRRVDFLSHHSARPSPCEASPHRAGHPRLCVCVWGVSVVPQEHKLCSWQRDSPVPTGHCPTGKSPRPPERRGERLVGAAPRPGRGRERERERERESVQSTWQVPEASPRKGRGRQSPPGLSPCSRHPGSSGRRSRSRAVTATGREKRNRERKWDRAVKREPGREKGPGGQKETRERKGN